MTGFKSFTTANAWATAADAEPKGGNTMTSALLLRLDAVPAAVNIIAGHGFVSGTGHNQWASGAAAQNFTVFDALNVGRSAPTFTWVAGDIGKVFLVVGTYEAGAVNAVKQFKQNAQVGTSTASVGYATPNAGVKSAIGVGCNTAGVLVSAAVAFTVVGWGVGNQALSLAQVQTLYTDCRAQNDLASFPGMQYRWQASDNVGLASPWTDDTGGIAMPRAGTGGVAESFRPVWG